MGNHPTTCYSNNYPQFQAIYPLSKSFNNRNIRNNPNQYRKKRAQKVAQIHNAGLVSLDDPLRVSQYQSPYLSSSIIQYNMGGEYLDDLTGDQLIGEIELFNIQPMYWSETVCPYVDDPLTHFMFTFERGTLAFYNTPILLDRLASAWAVRDGDVGAVPIPGGVWLLGSGLIGLIGIRRKIRS